MSFEVTKVVPGVADREFEFKRYIDAYAKMIQVIKNGEVDANPQNLLYCYHAFVEDLSEVAAVHDPTRVIEIKSIDELLTFRQRLMTVFLDCAVIPVRRPLPAVFRLARWPSQNIIQPKNANSTIIKYGLGSGIEYSHQKTAEQTGENATTTNRQVSETLIRLSWPQNFDRLRE